MWQGGLQNTKTLDLPQKGGMIMRILTLFIVAVLLTSLVFGCSGMSTRQQRVLSGGAIGAGAGAATSAITGGSLGWGAAVGAGAGALGGLIYDEMKRER
jgi:osmotically inducible lipoprotein OsmB